MISKEVKQILQSASELALALGNKTLLIVSDREIKKVWFERIPKKLNLIVASSNEAVLHEFAQDHVSKTIAFPSNNLSRFSKIRSILIAALYKGYIDETEKIVCLNGSIHNKEPFDSVNIINMMSHFRGLKHFRSYVNEYKIQLSVVVALMDIAIELGEFGREGKPYGAIFIIGDTKSVLSLSKQITINPFRGYKEKDRNVKNFSIKEDILEFSKLDGAFVIRGDGIISAASRLLFMPRMKTKVRHGLGSRHNAAAYMTKRTESIGIVVSESTGNITIFAKGKLLFQLKHDLMGRKHSI
jgi:DNA integrity scanning protein DisA with diadenylate cyclase activity